MRRLTLALATAVVAGALVASAGAASAGTHVKPVITASQATFAIPSSPTGVWQLTLTPFPTDGTQLGRTSGTSGTLTLPVPQTATCHIQADVKAQVGGTGKFVFYSGAIKIVPGCGQFGNGQRFTPGYWKNHEAAFAALPSQSLGNYVVATFADAQAVFDNMKCSDAVNCLAGHLLAAELDVANGSSICITGVIFQANQFLSKVGYTGPGTYTLTAAQRTKAINFAQTLDNYTNDSTSTSC